MKFILVSDFHLLDKNPIARIDDLTETQWNKVEFIFKFANENNATILQAGDLCNKPRSWSILPRLASLIKKYSVDVMSVRGQHDDYLYSVETRDKTNLGVLEKSGLIKILDHNPILLIDKDSQKEVAIYGASFGKDLPEPNDNADFRIGIAHISISENPIYPGSKFTTASKYLEKHKNYDLILCGDIHIFSIVKSGKRLLINTGPILRKEATDYNFEHKPRVILFDTNNPGEYKQIIIPHEPSINVLSRDHIERKEEVSNMLDDFVNTLGKNEELDDVSFKENLQNFLICNKIDQNVIDELAIVMEEQ